MQVGPVENTNQGHLAKNFCEVAVIGRGHFSTVFRARHRTDRQMYAIKKTREIGSGNVEEHLTEVLVLSQLAAESAACPNIVRYVTSWIEDFCLHIQTELCESSLRELLVKHSQCGRQPEEARLPEAEILKVFQHVATGLDVLHTSGFVHLDIKPDNILISRGNYKIADLGLATAAMKSACDDVSEGDCRYLAKEVLLGQLQDLPKADVFSLGVAGYELATNPVQLPCNGEVWHQLRNGSFDITSLIAAYSPLFLALLRSMLHPYARERPECKAICEGAGLGLEAAAGEVETLNWHSVGASESSPRLAFEAIVDEMKRRKEQAKRREIVRGCWQETDGHLLMQGHGGDLGASARDSLAYRLSRRRVHGEHQGQQGPLLQALARSHRLGRGMTM